MADSWWEGGAVGTEDAQGYEPVVLDLKASLRVAQRRFPEALELLDEAVDLFLNGEHQDPHLAGRSLIKKAGALIDQASPDSAIQALKKANGLIDPEGEPRLLLCLRHNLADNLSKAGRHREAAALLPDLEELAATHGSTLDRLRLSWVDARVAAGLGDHARAQGILTAIRQAFLVESNPFDAAFASLDLSISYLAEGKTAEVRELADEMVTVFRTLDIDREALAAFFLFQEAARDERLTVDRVEAFIEYFKRARTHPSLRFNG
jgi:tetratricopeptide (TPR) repeat protein